MDGYSKRVMLWLRKSFSQRALSTKVVQCRHDASAFTEPRLTAPCFVVADRGLGQPNSLGKLGLGHTRLLADGFQGTHGFLQGEVSFLKIHFVLISCKD